MAYITTQRKSELNVKQDDLLASKRYLIERKPETVLFYELEVGIVLDVILDENHPAFKNKNLDPVDWPVDANGEPAKDGQPNYGWIGMIKFRFVNSQQGNEKETLNWALPIENTGVTEFPLLNEAVVIGRYLNNYYYTRKLNLKSLINANASFKLERTYGLVTQNTDEYKDGKPYEKTYSVLNGGATDQDTNPGYVGVLGSYFKFNPSIRALKHYEGDTIIESRFGSSVRFGSYDENRGNDSGKGEYADQGGNPMILIRNRQDKVKGSTDLTKLINKGFVTESINNDGSSIHMTSGKTVSPFLTTVDKVIFQKTIQEEQPLYSPGGSTNFDYPVQDGDQIVINSDRLIFSSRANETFHFSKKRYSVVTDDEYTVDAQKQIVMTTNTGMSINSPNIHLGIYGGVEEPVLLGRSTVLWLYHLCDWMLLNTNTQIAIVEAAISHFHIDSKKGPTTPPMPPALVQWNLQLASLKAQQTSLQALQTQLDALMSKRVFVAGGGGEPGADGG